jgi:endonuclease/exonuclease/phosphatase family metal-dependent hydrolase
MRVVTWNVLHRVHGVNWKESPVLAFPDERQRIEAITGVVTGWLASGTTVACLQEVSGDQLASLRAALGDTARIFEHLYPRVPRLRDGGPSGLDDPTEHLVMVVNATPARLVESRTFDSDPGKGMLVVDVNGARVIDTHVSFGERGIAQLALLAATAGTERAVVLGDFNATAAAVGAALGEGFSLSDVAAQRPTRIETWEHPGRTIDHVAVSGATLSSAEVLDGKLLSDHNPVAASVLTG